MKFRIRRRSIRTVLEVPGNDECTFEALESAVGRHCGLVRGTYALSLNGREPLQLGERDSLNDAGIRSGDLIVILETCESGQPVACAGGGSSSPAAGVYDGVVRATAIASDLACRQQQRQSEGESAASPAPSSASAPPFLAISTYDEAAPACCASNISSEPRPSPITALAVPTDRTLAAQPECGQLIAAKPLAVARRADDCRDDLDGAKSNRCLREPLLVSEATAEQLPRSLTTALQSVVTVDGWSELDALFAVLHVLMIETGYQACELLSPQLQQPEAAATASTFSIFCGSLPPTWKTSFGYSVRYVHPLLGDAAAFCVVGTSLGPTTLVVRAIAGNKCLAVTELHVSDYVNRSGTGLNPLKTCKLSRLSCLFKDAFAHRLLSVLEEFLGLLKEGDSVEDEGTSCRAVCYRHWSPDLVRLPAEILFYLLGFLNPQGLVASGATCRLMLGACRQPLLWRRHYVARYGLPRMPTLIGFNWYEEYVRRCKERRQHELALSSLRAPFPVIPPWMPCPTVPFDPWPPVAPFFLPSQIDRRILQHFQPLRRY